MKRIFFHIILRIFCVAIMTLFSSYSFAQTQNIIWYTPSNVEVINGIGIGATNSGSENAALKQTINGLQLELAGRGLFSFPYTPPEETFMDGVPHGGKCITVNGIVLSLTGSIGVDRINGISISAFFSASDRVNGAAINPINVVNRLEGAELGVVNQASSGTGFQLGIYNSVTQFSGVQIGLININQLGSGLQIGLININKHRFLPFINF